MSDIVSIYATFGSAEEAARIGRQLVEEGLAACINIFPSVHSIYRWRGRIETGAEAAAILKAEARAADALIGRLVALHSYENPAVVVWPVGVTPPAFADWVKNNSVVS